MALSSRLVPTAQRLINKYGTSFVLTTYAQGTYDTSTSSKTLVSTLLALNGLVEEYPDVVKVLGNKTEANTLVQQGDKKLTVSATDLNQTPPKANQAKVAINGETYSIISVASQYVDNLVAYYVFQIRKT